MRYFMFLVLVLFLTLTTQANAQNPVTHKVFLSWDANTELSLSVFAYADDLGHCNLIQLFDDECADYIEQHGDPIVEYIAQDHIASVTWLEIEGYESFGVCVNKGLFDYGDVEFSGRLTVVGYSDGKLDQFYFVPITNEMLPCLGEYRLEDEYLDTDFIGSISTDIAPTIQTQGESELILRLIQPEDSSLIMFADIIPQGGAAPNFNLSVINASPDEIPTGTVGTDIPFYYKDKDDPDRQSFFVSFLTPDSPGALGPDPVPFAVAVYDQGVLAALYFGQTRNINQPWMGVYVNMGIDPLKLADYNPNTQVFSPLAGIYPLG